VDNINERELTDVDKIILFVPVDEDKEVAQDEAGPKKMNRASRLHRGFLACPRRTNYLRHKFFLRRVESAKSG